MKRKIEEKAFAKINLLLDVCGVRTDGYHTIDGVMQTVSLADRVTASFQTAEKTDLQIEVTGNPAVPQDSANLAWRAATAFLEYIGETGLVKIEIEKVIPTAAGLAGGSADAAATLRALNRIFENRLEENELCAIGEKLGADVPFCVCGGAMRTQGIGENLSPCPPLPACTLVIACAGTPVSTPLAYRKLDEFYHGFSAYPDPAKKTEKLIQVLAKGDLASACKHMYNIFEAPIQTENDMVLTLKKILKDHGAIHAMMSGSGPAVFGIFDSEIAANKTLLWLQKQNIVAHLCVPV